MTPPNDDTPEDFASLLAEFDKAHPTPKKGKRLEAGQVVKGRIVSIGGDSIFVEVGGKSEAVMDRSDVIDGDGNLTVKVGDEIEAHVVSAGEVPVLRRTLGRGPEAKAELQQAFAHQIPVEGVVSGVNKGGVEVQIAGTRAFCPISQLDLRHVENAADFVGQRLQFVITRYEPGRGKEMNLVVSRRQLLEEEAKKRAAETRAHLVPGAVVRGKVSAIKDYGAFVDIGGLEGMLHISELGFGRVGHPSDVLTVGQEIEVAVLKIEKGEDPRKHEKISLSLKSLEKDPWEGAAERFPEGARLRGKVVRTESFGAFVELAQGVEGLVHVSELGAGRRINHAREAVKIGQELDVTVLAVDTEKHRLSLSVAGAADEGGEAYVPPAPSKKSFGTLGDLLKKK